MRYKHFVNCKGVNYLVDILDINNHSEEHKKSERKSFGVNLVRKNICIIHKAKRWEILLFKEALKIKEKCPALNSRLKAYKELKPFLFV